LRQHLTAGSESSPTEDFGSVVPRANKKGCD